ncbi:hypothetical protein COY93_01600 [Candidatus Uhrbacteria bacterium CG_4_10_14_0_8_um_filter_58_22]|uniref:Predicted 3'-5' exonuclease PolB-like domain-containing protein n=1 Tax=Candidatus Uhrbacteria bacterium CG_4_10_14_0_8_um_filter_58_22 TaxID=1975029 RepID=A0A2M7QAD9_9BACT|nr:MAG: hypothetical protein AUJ19_03320 [Parcubacteria group bacterium CG1_02_58_44]PIY62979.1 MAG: hypothetical protein COY93_01600 [Candidatus Uhrbacteria bacterium CG_4_10_14_0_8_um_filter_58_22]
MDTGYYRTVIFDIETVARPFERLDPSLQDKVVERAATRAREESADPEATLEEEKNLLALNPLYAEVAAIGVLDAETDRGAVYYVAPGQEGQEIEEDDIKLSALSEGDALRRFWEVARACRKLVGFNSRTFDVPFLNVRSAVNGLRPSVDLMANRYLKLQPAPQHIDLLDQLTFYGATWPRRGSLHEWCLAFGISSPKVGGVSGSEVGQMFTGGRYLDIARYNVRDLQATRELYRRWDELLNFQK